MIISSLRQLVGVFQLVLADRFCCLDWNIKPPVVLLCKSELMPQTEILLLPHKLIHVDSAPAL